MGKQFRPPRSRFPGEMLKRTAWAHHSAMGLMAPFLAPPGTSLDPSSLSQTSVPERCWSQAPLDAPHIPIYVFFEVDALDVPSIKAHGLVSTSRNAQGYHVHRAMYTSFDKVFQATWSPVRHGVWFEHELSSFGKLLIGTTVRRQDCSEQSALPPSFPGTSIISPSWTRNTFLPLGHSIRRPGQKPVLACQFLHTTLYLLPPVVLPLTCLAPVLWTMTECMERIWIVLFPQPLSSLSHLADDSRLVTRH